LTALAFRLQNGALGVHEIEIGRQTFLIAFVCQAGGVTSGNQGAELLQR
jgi:hypothetical protein